MHADAPAPWLRRLWERMTSAYGHAWTSVHGTSPQNPQTGALTVDGDTWARALAGITAQQLGAGLDACMTQGGEFPPSAPRFRAMCLGIPTIERVRIELTQPDVERSPFTRSVWMHVDGYRYRHASQQDADRMLRAAYDVAHDLAMQGHALPGPSLELEAPKPQPSGIPKTREERIEYLRQKLGPDFNPACADPNYDPVEARRKRERAETLEALQRERGAAVEVDHDEEDLPW